MTLRRIKALLSGQPAYRVRQAARAIFTGGAESFQDIRELPTSLRNLLAAEKVLCMAPEAVRISKDGLARKAILRLVDGRRIESVLMRSKPGTWTACISSQVGCALACTFCATGLMGFDRNLSGEEITDQVLFWRQHLRANLDVGGRLSNVVYMGMGEPMLNLDAVLESLRSLTAPEEFGMGQRHLSVSTVGIIPGMRRFARAFPQVNLALSLHSATPELRRRLVPIEKSYSLDRLREALQEYFQTSRRKVFIEYVLLAGENDRPEDAHALIRFLESAGPRPLLHVNLIVWNPTATPHKAGGSLEAKRFARMLEEARISVTFRRNLGRDIDGACGQLVLRSRLGSPEHAAGA